MRNILFLILGMLLVLVACRSAHQAAPDGVAVEKVTAADAGAGVVLDTAAVAPGHDSLAAADSVKAKAKKKAGKKRRPKRKTHRQKPKRMADSTATATSQGGTGNKPKIDIDDLKRRAEEGDSVAQTQLGVEYIRGENVEKDPEMAAQWWKKAAEKGHPEALYKMGICYQFGFGVKRSRTKAKACYSLAAGQGHESAAAAVKALEEE